MTVQTVQTNKYEEAAWQIGAALVALLVAGTFWVGVAYSTVVAVVWVLSIGADVTPSMNFYAIPAAFSIIEMALYILRGRLRPEVRRLGHWITGFDMLTTVSGIALVILYSARLAPYWLDHSYIMWSITAVISIGGGWYSTLWPERIMVDAVKSIIDALKSLA